MSEPKLGIGSGEKREPAPSPIPGAPEAAPSPEVPQPEQAEAGRETPEAAQERAMEMTPGDAAESRATPSKAPVPVPVNTQDPYLMKVERVLEDGMWDVYVSLPEKARELFKKQGEETAAAIRVLISRAHVRASKIHDLVHKWLGRIPGVNEFFLLQESKIKTDQFVRLAAWILHRGGLG